MKRGQLITGASAAVGAWLDASDYDAAVWTALPSNFQEKTGTEFSIANAVQYLASLTADTRKRAYRYFVEAPDAINTALRQESHWPEAVAVHEAGHFLAACSIGLETVWLSHLPFVENPGDVPVRGHRLNGDRSDEAELALNLAGPWAQITLCPESVNSARRTQFLAANRIVPYTTKPSWQEWATCYGPLGWLTTDMKAAHSFLTYGDFPFKDGLTFNQVLAMVDTHLGQWMDRPAQTDALRLVCDRLMAVGQVLRGEPLAALRKEVLAMVNAEQRADILPSRIR